MTELSRFNKRLVTSLGTKLKPKKAPYISVNKLAEYMDANSIRRRQIIKTLKEDVTFKKAYYTPVKNVLHKYFANEYDQAVIDTAIKKIKKKDAINQWEATDYVNSILALEALKKMDLPNLYDFELSTETTIDTITLGGMVVSLKPEIYLTNKHSNKVGAFKLHFAKTPENRLSKNSRQYAATLLKYGFISNGINEKEIDDNFCISVDVFSEEFSFSPKAYKTSIHALTALFVVIADRWDSL